jgi:hypothetical protein
MGLHYSFTRPDTIPSGRTREYKRRFNQEAVLRTTSRGKAQTYE